MIRPLFANHPVVRRNVPLALSPDLELALGVFVQRFLQDLLESRLHQPGHQLCYGVQPLVEIDGADDRFKGGAERGRPVAPAAASLAVTQAQAASQIKLPGEAGEGPRPYQSGAQRRQLAFVHLREAFVEVSADDEVQHSVAEKLQPFVILQPCFLALVQIRTMSEGALQKVVIGYVYLETLFQRAQLVFHALSGSSNLYSANSLSTRTALCPPKPKALLRATRTGAGRASLGT